MKKINLKIREEALFAYIVVLCFFCSIIFSSYIFLILVFALSLKELYKTRFIVIFLFVFSIYFLVLGFDTFKYFLLMCLSIILVSEKFKNNPKILLQAYSNVCLICLIYLTTLDQKYGDISSVFQFKDRFWPVIKNGEELNPNAVGIYSSICALGYYVNRNRFIMLIPIFFLLATQSRSAIMFFLMSVAIFNGIKILNLISYFLLLMIFLYALSVTGVFKRFVEDGENGRLERIFHYSQYIKENYISGMGYSQYIDVVKNVGSLDNLFLSVNLVYGIFGVFFLILICYSFYNNKMDENYKIRLGLFLSFFALGFLEGSFAFNHLLWIIFALSFNSFSSFQGKFR
ncbi:MULTISPECIES: hypothetical protein [unclassified Acinetobacter]|uniref:hypothetical protein n=1 Tax=unclassified Acinetobacter TaxID=196816 RepID=UPI0015D42B03|nr:MULTISPECIES: hypothetical protein [unclassified Acinetobacter]UUS60880.1 hypothetical protein MST17_00430 [Acinetobacter sp. YH16056_T]